MTKVYFRRECFRYNLSNNFTLSLIVSPACQRSYLLPYEAGTTIDETNQVDIPMEFSEAAGYHP